LTGLRRLYVGAVIGSDAVFAHVLKPAINDNQLVQLRALPNLEALAIGNAESITDAGLAAFSRQADIRQLRLYDAVQITDAGFAALASLYRLESLSVTDASGVTDGGLRAVARLPTLRSLALNGSKITDQGVQCLHSATQIESVDFCRTQVSQAGLRKLRDALPSCKISPYVYPDVARKPAGTKWPSQSAVQPAGADEWRLGPAGNSHAIPSLAPNGPRTEE
jgi:hypothetical protein